MRKFFARLCSLVLLVVVMLSFTACSLFTDNYDKKYSSKIMVASLNNSDITVSRKELYDVYREWGYQYAGQMDQETLLEKLTESIINNKIMRQISIEQFGTLYSTEKALARKNTYTAIDDVLREYIYESLELPDDTSTAAATDDAVTYQPYTKTILVENYGATQDFTLNLASYAENTEELDADDYQMYTPNLPSVATTSTKTRKVACQALSRICRNLLNMEKGFEKLPQSLEYLNTNDVIIASLSLNEQYALNREIARIIETNETSIYAARLSVAYNLGIKDAAGWQGYLERGRDFEGWQEMINAANGQTIATDRANKVIEQYKKLVTSSIVDYSKLSSLDGVESSIMGKSLDEVYYVPQNVANNLFTVSHILVGFTDTQKAQYAAIKKEATNNPNYNANNALNNLYAATQSNGKTVYEIYNDLKSSLDMTDTLQERYDVFRDYIYMYNTDPGMQNPTYEYLMSVNKGNNQMIESFTDASIALRQNKQKGAISGIVWGDYGAHIIMYTRDLADFVWTGDKSMLGANYAKTLFAPLTAYGNKTKFDVLAESYTRDYSAYQATLLREYKSQHQVTMTKEIFKDFI